MLKAVQSIGRKGFAWLAQFLQTGFGSGLIPLQYLGALTIFFFWIVLVSGIWLLMFFRTSVDGAYESVEYLTHQQWYIGGVMRSLHRYASDAAVVTLLLHIAREWSFDNYRNKRWFSWITGIPLLWLVIPLGITGYWLVWDSLAQYVALTSAELLDWLPIFTDSMARNFLSSAALSDRFFTLMAFLHLIGLPLVLVFALWLHVIRISSPRINPPRQLMVGTLIALIVLALVYPAHSQEQADLALVPQTVSLDWYYLLVYPLMKSWSPGWVWLLLVGISLLLLIAPWLPPARARPVARVDLDNCNGCARCADDCPFGAIMMQPRSDGMSYEHEAVVDASQCVSCGICVGACPTATPFRRASELIPGIDLPELTAAVLREQVESAGAGLQGDQRVLVFGCAGSAALDHLEDRQTAVIRLECMGQLPPPFVDYILSRDLADGVFLAGCTGGGCNYRLGAEWTAARLNRQRDPQLRKRIDRQRIALGCEPAWEKAWISRRQAGQALAAFRRQLVGLASGAPANAAAGASAGAVAAAPGRSWWRRRLPAQILAYGLFVLAASVFSAWPALELLQPGQGMVSLTFSHAGQRLGECRHLTQQEMDQLPPNMRQPTDCPRERRPVEITFQADGQLLYREVLQPSGIWNDGESTVYARFPLEAGRRRLFIGMNDSGRSEGFDYELEAAVELAPEQHVVVEFDSDRGVFIFR